MKTEIVYEAEQDPTFLAEILSSPEGEAIPSCIQCGTCSGTCPVAPAMQHTPRQLFAMLRAGMKEKVLRSSTPWLCASCYKCTVNCPAQIKITEVMYALRRRAAAAGLGPADSSGRRFSRIFTDMVCRYGRGFEMGLMLKFMMFHKPLELLRQAPVGMEMLRSGRMPLLPHKIRDREGFSKMVQRALKTDMKTE